MMFVVMVMVMVVITTLGRDGQFALKIVSYRLIGVGFGSDQRLNALGGEATAQARPHTAGNQYLHIIQRMRGLWRTFVERLLD